MRKISGILKVFLDESSQSGVRSLIGIVLLPTFLFTSLSFAQSNTANINEVKLSGTVRHIRENPVPEILFSDLSGTYLIPSNNDFARFYGAFHNSMKSKKPVQFTYDKKLRMIVNVDGAYSKTADLYESEPPPQSDDKDKKSDAQDVKKSIDSFIQTLEESKKK